MKSGDTEMELVRRYLSGESSKTEVRRLESMLMEDMQLRQDFLSYARLDAALSATARPSLTKSTPARAWGTRIPVTAAAVLVLLGLAWLFVSRSTPALGTITQVLNMETLGEDEALVVGQQLKAGRVLLSRGAMEIRLSNGVTLLFEGPGELELLSPMRAMLRSGQVVVRVPQNAIGFRMDAPSARVVDLGTEFAMKAGPGLETDVQVFEGVVEASPARGGFTSRLPAGSAARFTPAESSPKELPYSGTRFLRQLPIKTGVPMPATRGKNRFSQARHAEVVIPSVKEAIRVDGDLSEWTDEGRFFSRLDAKRSVEGRMRHDASAFYIAAHIEDPSPMRNMIDPSMDGEVGWRGGGLQVRLSLDRALGWPVDANSPSYYRMRKLTADAEQISRAGNERLVTLTFWHHEPSATDCLHLDFGMDYHGGLVNPPDYSAVFKRDLDDSGYTIEARVPWTLLRAANNPPRPGDQLAVCWHTHWSDSSGRTWRDSLVELRNPSEPLRIYDFERAATWGRAIYR